MAKIRATVFFVLILFYNIVYILANYVVVCYYVLVRLTQGNKQMRTINTEFAVKRDGKLDFWATYSPQVLPRLVQSIEHSQLAFNEAVDGSVWLVGAFKRQVDRINRGELVG